MHATTSQLIALRDGEPAAADIRAHVRDCPTCHSAMNDLEDLAGALRTMPALTPPAGSWKAIEQRLERKTRRRRFWPTALAAGLAGALAVGIWFAVVPSPTDNGSAVQIASLRSEAAWLEAVNNAYRETGRPMPLASEATLNTLEGELENIDRTLAEAESPDRQLNLLQRRVALLEASVTLQAAEGGGLRVADTTL